MPDILTNFCYDINRDHEENAYFAILKEACDINVLLLIYCFAEHGVRANIPWTGHHIFTAIAHLKSVNLKSMSLDCGMKTEKENSTKKGPRWSGGFKPTTFLTC